MDPRTPAAGAKTMIAPCKITAAAELLDLKILSKSPSEWRIGNKGSLSLDLNKDCFYDHEHLKGGGVLDFIQYLGDASNPQEAVQFLEDNDLIEKSSPLYQSLKSRCESISITISLGRTFKNSSNILMAVGSNSDGRRNLGSQASKEFQTHPTDCTDC